MNVLSCRIVDHSNTEVMCMQWRKCDLWKTGIAITGILLLLLLMVWLPLSAANTHEGTSGVATPGTVTVQTTPTVDPAITAKTAQEQLTKLQRDNDRSLRAWFWNLSATLGSIVAALLAVAGVLWATKVAQNKNLADSQAERTRRDEEQQRWLKNQEAEREKRDEEQNRWLEDREAERERRKEEQQRWLKNQEAEREKRAEERFQAVVAGLGSEREEAKVGAAIMLRTFLQKGYEQFYSQAFDLAIAHLRLPRTPHPSEDPDGTAHSPQDPDAALPLTTLSQALIVVFKEAFPLARDRLLEEQKAQFKPQSLDATGIQLDNAFLWKADLRQAWMPQAFLQKADLGEAKLCEAKLREAKLDGADLRKVNLSEADLRKADLRKATLVETNLLEANLREANLSEAQFVAADLRHADLSFAQLFSAQFTMGTYLSGANLRHAGLEYANLFMGKLSGADLSGAKLHGADLRETILSDAILSDADLSKAKFNGATLSRAHPEEARSLEETDLCGVTGLTKEQLAACKAKGAIIDEDD